MKTQFEIRIYDSGNNSTHLDLLRPMWIDYMHEIGECASDEEFTSELQTRIDIATKHDHIFFDIIWSGNDAVGFVFYSVDGGIRELIPAGYGYIMEFYLVPQWRGLGIGSHIVTDVCTKLKALGCPKAYLTSVPDSVGFWMSMGFHDSGMSDPDNALSIFLKDL